MNKGDKFYTYLEDDKEILWKLYATKFDSTYKVDKFLERYNLLKLKQEEMENINSPISI